MTSADCNIAEASVDVSGRPQAVVNRRPLFATSNFAQLHCESARVRDSAAALRQPIRDMLARLGNIQSPAQAIFGISIASTNMWGPTKLTLTLSMQLYGCKPCRTREQLAGCSPVHVMPLLPRIDIAVEKGMSIRIQE
jgi:hypothetical protein